MGCTSSKMIIDHKWVYDRNYVCLLHSYGNLCSWLHKYFLTFLLSMYNYYVTPFSYHELHINYTKTFQNKNIDSLHNSIP